MKRQPGTGLCIMSEAMIILIITLLAWVLTAGVRHHAAALQLLDIPNERSSHVSPTPRGGGVAIVLAALLGGSFLAWQQGDAQWWALAGLSMSIAVLGLWDDVRSLSARLRLLVHLLACMLAVAWLGGFANSGLGLVLVFAGVWWLNLFNFMDGIDGLAASEAMFIAAAGWVLADGQQPVWLPALFAACGGFLFWNWSPAKIFMGDVGSTWLGFMLFLAVLCSELSWQVWLILAALFVVDASLTLGVRLLRGVPVARAHREHLYQILARRWGSHARVTLFAAVFNLFILLPLAWWAAVAGEWAGGLLFVVYAGLGLGWLYMRQPWRDAEQM